MALLRILRGSQLNIAVAWYGSVQNAISSEVHDAFVQSPADIQSSLCYLVAGQDFGGREDLGDGLYFAFGGWKISAGRIAKGYHAVTRLLVMRSLHDLHHVRCREINYLLVFDEIPDRAVRLLLCQSLHRKVIQ